MSMEMKRFQRNIVFAVECVYNIIIYKIIYIKYKIILPGVKIHRSVIKSNNASS